jgi:hypothetical protein
MLDHHPDIAFEHESDILVAMVSDDGRLPPIEAYHHYLHAVRGLAYSIDPSLDYRELVNDFLQQKVARSGKKGYLGATVHHHFDRLIHLWPNARFIHLIRDPRDVARSVLEKRWAGNLYHAADWWTEAERCWGVLKSKLPPERYVEVRYEDLVTDPEAELARVCAFIGVPFAPSMLEYQKSAPQYPKPDARLALQWKKRMTPDEIAVIEYRTGRLLTERGYPAASKPISVGPLRHKWLMLQSRLIRFGHRIERLGLGLVCIDFLGRRTGVAALADYAQQRINVIEDEYIRQEAAGLRGPSANIAPVSQQGR